MRFIRCYLVVGFVLGAALAVATAHCQEFVRVLIIDTGVDFKTSRALRDVACPAQDSLNAVTGARGIPIDEHGHGTHIAGIIRALAGDKGYCLAVCKFYSDANPGSVNLKNEIKCLKHAADIGALVVNLSEGGPEFAEDEYLAIKRLPDTRFFAAAGNEKQDTSVPGQEYYPASYGLPNVTVVGALDFNGKRVMTSNFGTRVAVALPGENLYSSLPGGKRGYMTGTSQATAIATGLWLRTRFGLPPIGNHQAYWKLLNSFWRTQP